MNSLVGFYLKHHRLVNEHDTKDSNELKEDHSINYRQALEFGLDLGIKF